LFDVTLTPAGRRLERKAQCIPEEFLGSTGVTEEEAGICVMQSVLNDAALNSSQRKESA